MLHWADSSLHPAQRALTSALSAIALYKKLGFTETEAYYENPYEDALYLKLTLS